MKMIRGVIVLPPEVPVRIYRRVVVEVRDVSELDKPSIVVAQQVMTNISAGPASSVAFELTVPDMDSRRSLSLRSHLSLDGGVQVKHGDLLTTASFPLPAGDALARLRVNLV